MQALRILALALLTQACGPADGGIIPAPRGADAGSILAAMPGIADDVKDKAKVDLYCAADAAALKKATTPVASVDKYAESISFKPTAAVAKGSFCRILVVAKDVASVKDKYGWRAGEGVFHLTNPAKLNDKNELEGKLFTVYDDNAGDKGLDIVLTLTFPSDVKTSGAKAEATILSCKEGTYQRGATKVDGADGPTLKATYRITKSFFKDGVQCLAAVKLGDKDYVSEGNFNVTDKDQPYAAKMIEKAGAISGDLVVKITTAGDCVLDASGNCVDGTPAAPAHLGSWTACLASGASEFVKVTYAFQDKSMTYTTTKATDDKCEKLSGEPTVKNGTWEAVANKAGVLKMAWDGSALYVATKLTGGKLAITKQSADLEKLDDPAGQSVPLYTKN